MEEKSQNFENYSQQLEEIEILKNILLEKVTIIKSEPNFHIQIEIEGENLEEKPIKTFYLEFFLNNNYPEKSPRFIFYEVNDYINQKRKDNLIKKLNEYCKENQGMTILYQLYEIVKEFADEEEKIALRKKEEEKRGKIIYQLNSLQKIKQIQFKDTYPINLFIIKNGNILVIFENGSIKIYDNNFVKIIFETLNSNDDTSIIFCKYFDFSPKNNLLYLFDINKHVLIYKLTYLSKKITIDDTMFKMNGNVKIEYLSYISGKDVIELPKYPNHFFLIKNEDVNALFHEYNKENFISKEIVNDYEQPFRKMHYVNQDKFILASYTLKTGKYNNKTGINKMLLIETENFDVIKEYDIKISPLNNSIETYKKDYLIISYFSTLKEGEENQNDPYYNFNDNFYLTLLYNIYSYEYDEYEYLKDNIRYYSYDIKQHYIGIYSIKYETFVTLIESELINRIYNINDNLLCVFVKNGKNNKITQISYEIIFHEYYNNIDEEVETKKIENYKTEKYLAYTLLDNGINYLKGSIDYDNITCIKEINKNCLAICSERRGIVFYN